MNELAQKALEEAQGDWSKAFELMLQWVEDNPDALEEVIRHGCWHAIQIAAANVRTQYFRSAASQCSEGVSGETQARTSSADLRSLAFKSWYNYQLPGGVRLGDADREKLDAAHQRYEKLANSNAQRARFVDRVRENVHGEKTVEECLNEERIEEIAKETLGC